MDNLTDRQRSVLDFIRERLAQEGEAPTQLEIAQAFGIQLRAVQDHLQALERKAALELRPGKSRGIRLAGASQTRSAALELPLVGRVAAGQPILAEAHVERHISIDRYVFRPRPDYFLRVVGASMRDAGILDGDLLAVQRTPDASDGQIVVARIDGEITVKRLRRTATQILLLPENPDFATLVVDPQTDDFAIEGCYVGVIRGA